MTPSPPSLHLWNEDPAILAAELFRWSERLVGTDGAAIHLLTERGLEARWLTETSLQAGDLIAVDVPEPDPMGRAARYGMTQVVSEQSELDSRSIGPFGWKSAVLVPLLVGSRVVGVFSAGWSMPVPVTDEIRLVLEAAASLTASTLHRAGLLEDVKREQYRLREVLEGLPVVATIIDQESLVVRWANRRARRLFGEVEGRNAHHLLVGRGMQVFFDGTVPTSEGVRTALRGRIPLGRVKVRTVEGGWRVLESTVAPLDGGVSLLMHIDVTRDAHMESERDRFVHMLSHHLRTPLTPVLGFVDLMADSELDPDTRREAVATVKSSVRRIENVISRMEQIASLRPVEAGAMTSLPVRRLVLSAATRVEELSDDMLEVTGGEDVTAHCAGSHVVQALQELLHNSVVHGAPPVRVTIQGGAHATIEVRDSGSGIPPEWEKAVFSPFLNAGEGYLAPSPDSLGLGLSLARALVLATGGDLSYSEGAFYLQLRTASSPSRGDLEGHGIENAQARRSRWGPHGV